MGIFRLFALALALAFVLCSNISKAQWVSIPDTNFGKWLSTYGFISCLQGNSTVGWQMDTTCNKIATEKNVYCYYNSISDMSGIQYFKQLENFVCYGNNISSFPPLPATVKVFDCSNQNQGLQPVVFPVLPWTLREFNCSGNPSTLPVLPLWLKKLDVRNMGLTALPALPASLEYLACDTNNLAALPLLPNTLKQLNCSYNQITTLPNLPASLHTLWCGFNPLTTLPAIPGSVVSINLQSTNISALPALPDSLGLLRLTNTPNLHCLPELKRILYLAFDSVAIPCLSNRPLGPTYGNVAIATYPLCSYFNNYGCSVYWNVGGKLYKDINGNCISNAGETGFENIKLQLWQNGALLKQAMPSEGLYSFDVDNYGTYQITVDTSNTPLRVKCPASGSLTSVVTGFDSIDYNMDFALECKPGFDLEAKSVFGGIFRPANYTTLEIGAGDATNFYNANCAAGVSGNVTLSFTGPVKYIQPASGALIPTLTGNMLTWNVTDFGAVNFFEDFDIVVQTDTTAQAWQQICFTLTVNPIANDNNPANNVLTQCFSVVNSYDPNDKQVSPYGNIDTTQKELIYTVRFQNTGNAEAQHIYITDTLSNHINPASFQLLAYSHQPMVQIDGNKVRFNYANINLPDSTTNEPGSHGYVQYKVKLKDNLPIGSIIRNTAFIYFDFNPPVVTNTTSTTIYVPQPGLRPVSIGKYRIQRAAMPNGKL